MHKLGGRRTSEDEEEEREREKERERERERGEGYRREQPVTFQVEGSV